jgi:hypothetical protein
MIVFVLHVFGVYFKASLTNKNFVVLAASCCFSEQKFLENYQKIKIFWIKFSGHREKFS